MSNQKERKKIAEFIKSVSSKDSELSKSNEILSEIISTKIKSRYEDEYKKLAGDLED